MSSASVLIDSGAMVALLKPRDIWHEVCVEALGQLPMPMLLSQAVLTEFFYFMSRDSHQVNAAWRLVRSGAIELSTIHHEELPPVHALMDRYADRPMSFADATLVYLAQREQIATIFTVDHDNFETYRIRGNRRFRVVPERRKR